MIKGFLKPPPLGWCRMGNGKMERDAGLYRPYHYNNNYNNHYGNNHFNNNHYNNNV